MGGEEGSCESEEVSGVLSPSCETFSFSIAARLSLGVAGVAGVSSVSVSEEALISPGEAGVP